MTRDNRGTVIMIFLIIIIFFFTELLGGSTNTGVLIKAGALWGPLVLAGQFWRLITAVFLHIGWAHLIMNSLALWIWGQQVEQQLGTWRFILLFVISGIAGNLLSLILNPMVISAGASGAIFGLFAAQLYIFRQSLGRWETNILVYAIFMLLYGFMIPAVNGWAHLGGAAFGFILSAFFWRSNLSNTQKKWRQYYKHHRDD